MFPLIRCAALALAASSLVVAPPAAVAEAVYAIEAIDVQIHDRTTGELVPLEQPYPNDYGMNMDLLIRVSVRQVAGELADWPPPDLWLQIAAPGYDYPATGPMPPLEITERQPLEIGSLNETYHFLFLTPYQCYCETELTARVPGAEQTRAIALGCAE